MKPHNPREPTGTINYSKGFHYSPLILLDVLIDYRPKCLRHLCISWYFGKKYSNPDLDVYPIINGIILILIPCARGNITFAIFLQFNIYNFILSSL
jgi:hypothetical protein